MFEFIVVVYVGLNLLYILKSRKRVSDQDQENILFVAGHPVVERLPEAWRNRLLSGEEALKLSRLHSPKYLEEGSFRYLSEKLGLVYLILSLGVLFAMAFGKDYTPSSDLPIEIERPAFGESSEELTLSYRVEGEESKWDHIPVVVEAQLPVGDQALKVLEDKVQAMVEVMLTGGDSKDHVVNNLNFNQQPFDLPIEVFYSSLTPQYLTDKGELRRNSMELGGRYTISVKVTMVLSGLKMDNVYDFDAYREPMSLGEELAMVGERIEVEEDKVILPDRLLEQDRALGWQTSASGVKWFQILGLAAVLAVMVMVFRKEELNKALELRQEQILMDFPDVVSKLTMLINAGMTLSRAWHKVVTDYQEKSKLKRPLYEEMLITTSQIQNGMPEREALEAFGRRTGSKEVIRMSALLIQNLRRGSHSLTEALKQLSQEAWEIRTNSARKLGEKASTKLLLPMGISFVTVIIIVIAPTLMSMSI